MVKRGAWVLVRGLVMCASVLAGMLTAGTAAGREPVILAHYMSWYSAPPTSKVWGWHWTMNHFDPERIDASGKRAIASHHYPLVGPYDSGDPDLLEYHVLLMKLAGIQGVVVDWYGRTAHRDYGEIHRNTERLIEHLERAGLKFAICFEDQAIGHLVTDGELAEAEVGRHAADELRWMATHWFGREGYVQVEGRPVLLVFGPQYLGTEVWQAIERQQSPAPRVFTLPHLADKVPGAGVFGWPPVSGGRAIGVADWNRYLRGIYARADVERRVVGCAFPGFQDIYQQAALHDSYGSIDDRNGQTLEETLDLAMASRAPLVQIATWNDFGEGTVVEPTREHGFQRLQTVQKSLGRRHNFSARDLRLPLALYQLRKRETLTPAERARVEKAAEHLYAGRCEEARGLLRTVAVDAP